MPTRRYARRPKLNPQDRAFVRAAQIRAVDAFLKELRSYSQQVSPLVSCLNDELRILERMYYKGVNQHRSAIFWRRVEETRKLGRRIAEIRLGDLIEDLRYAFYLPEGGERQ